jgi:hypothetical protein
MAAGLSVALLFLAAYGPAAAAPPNPAAPPQLPAPRDCAAQNQDPKANQIVVCAIRPQGYRIDPDVLEARRLKKQGSTGRPHNPHESYADRSCATVGPMGCRGQVTVDAFTAAAVLAEMGAKLAKGQPIGPMFKTQPTESEYQLYLDAKKEREEEEAAKAAKAKAAAAQAAAGGAQTHN